MKTRVVGGVVLAFLFSSLQVFGQVGIWKNYTSMQDVRSIARGGNTIWAATSGGLFAWTEGSESYTKYTSADGLRSTDLTTVGIDKYGNIWTGTSTGFLHVFTPETNTWRYIPDIAGTNQTDKRVNSISFLGDTALVATNFGLSVFQISQFQFGDTYTKFGSLTGNVRVAVYSATVFNNKIWATVSGGQSTSRIASASLSNPNLLPPELWTLEAIGNASTTPKQLAVFNNRLYAGTSSGLFVLSGSSWVAHDSLVGRNIVALTSSANYLLVAEASNVVDTISFQGRFGRFGTQITAADTVKSISTSSADKPIVGTINGGVKTFQDSWVSHFPNGPTSNQFVSVAVDLDGYVWGASGINGGGKGFYRFNGKAWKSFTRQNSRLPFNDYYRVSLGCNGDVWIGSWARGVVLMPRGAESVDSANIFGRNVGISGILEDPNAVVVGPAICDYSGNTWMTAMKVIERHPLAIRRPDGSWTQLAAYVGGNPQLYLSERDVTRALAIDASNNVWMTSVFFGAKGVACLSNRGSVTDSVADIFITADNGLPSNEIKTIVIDRDNDIWVGTESGIGIILDPANPTRTGGVASYKPLNGLFINAIVVDPLNKKWVATNEGALLLSSDGTQTLAQYNVENTNGKIIDNEIKDIAFDAKNGTVYFATLNGLASLTTTSAQPKAEFEELVISPNPFKIPSPVPLTIEGLVENSRIKILTIDGHLIREMQTPGGRIGFWDGKDDSGKDVASGVYLVVAYSETQKDKVGKGKVAILRK